MLGCIESCHHASSNELRNALSSLWASPPQTNTVLKNWFEKEKQDMVTFRASQQCLRILLSCFRPRTSERESTPCLKRLHVFVVFSFLQGAAELARGVHALGNDGVQGPLLPAGVVHDLHQAQPPPPRRQLVRQHLHLLRHGRQIQVNM